MRGRRFKTQADIERYIAQGYGQGQGAEYRPWLRVQDVPSQGRSRKVSGLKVNRNHHLLSDLEFAYFVVLEFSEDVVDIREQYPLLPTSDLQQIAHARSIRYPKFAGTDLPYVLTTDFLVTYKASNGTTQLAARTVKYSDALEPSKSLERTLQKLEIERCFWLEQGVDWGIVTQKAIPAALSENLQWLRQAAEVDKGLLQPGIQQRFLDALDRLNPADRILSANIRMAGQAAHMHYKDATQLFKHLVWHKSILLDLKSAPLRLTGVVPEFRFANLDASFERVAA
jgi:hypothetical protein